MGWVVLDFIISLRIIYMVHISSAQLRLPPSSQETSEARSVILFFQFRLTNFPYRCCSFVIHISQILSL
jgi:hypothetical protein